jgi:hypothetical protein
MHSLGYYTKIESIQSWFFENNTDKEKNPFWVVYHGDSDKSKKAAFNYHVSQPLESWKLLHNNIERYVETGGIFTICLADKAKDTAASATIYVKFSPFGTQKATNYNGIAGLPQGMDLNTYVAEKVELSQLKKDLSDLKTGKNWVNHPLIGAFVGHPNFDPNKSLTVIAGLLHRGMDFLDRDKITPSPTTAPELTKTIAAPPSVIEEKTGQTVDRLHVALTTIKEKTGQNPVDFLEKLSNWANESDTGTVKYVLSLLEPTKKVEE